jgi:hypothetical protein
LMLFEKWNFLQNVVVGVLFIIELRKAHLKRKNVFLVF